MAEPITIQKLIDASIDSDTLESLVNGDENTQVVTRTGETYPSVKKAIYTLFENGGLPATPFETAAQMQTDGASLVDGKIAIVYNEVANNGLYVKKAGAWVKTAYSPASQSYVESAITSAFENPIVDLDALSKNINDVLNGGVDLTADMLVNTTLTRGYYVSATNTLIARSTYSYTDYMTAEPSHIYRISYTSAIVGVFYDASKVMLSAIKTPAGLPDFINNFEFTAPAGAVFMRINILHDNPVTLLDVTPVAKVEAIEALKSDVALLKQGNVATGSQWTNKKIAWYGTSIPAGSPKTSQQDIWSHANLAVKDMGASIINKAVPSGCVSEIAGSPSFTRLTDAINYQNSLVDLLGTVDDPALVVFDYGVNDIIYGNKASINAFDPNDPLDKMNTGTKTRIDSRDKTTFIGAYNTVIDAMLAKKPTQKFCFLTHFSNDNAHPNVTTKEGAYTTLNINIEGLAKYWSAPVFILHSKTNFRNRNGFNSITPLMPDGVHPASGDGRAVASLRNIVRDFLISIA